MKRNFHSKTLMGVLAATLLFSLFNIGVSGVHAEEESDPWKLVSQFGGSTQAVAVAGSVAYVGVGLRVNVVDISDPSQPRLIGMSDVFSDMVLDIAIQGNTAYVAAGDAGLQIVDISDPKQPKKTGEWNSNGFAEGVAAMGRFVLLANGPMGVSVINAYKPSAPRLISSAFRDHYVFDVVISGRYAYAAAADSGLLVVDLTNIFDPKEVSWLDTYGYAYEAAVSGSTLYLADAWEGVAVVDISDPSAPVQSANIATSGWSLGVAVSANRLVSLNGVQGCELFDVTDPVHPVKTASYLKKLSDGDTSSRRAVITQEKIYVADTINGLRVLEVSNSGRIRQTGLFSQLSYARRVTISGEYAYVATASEGAMYIINISDPLHPYQASKFQADGIAVDVVISGEHATLGTFEDSSNCYTVIDISDPANPTEAGALSVQNQNCGSPRQMAAVGDYLYSADEAGISVYDLSRPQSFKTLARLDLQQEGHQTVALAVAGDYAYVADAGAGLKIVDISDPANPRFVRAYTAGNTVGSITSVGDMLYVGQYGMGVITAKNATPGSNPVTLDIFQTRSSIEEAAVSGGILVASEGSGGLEILDVSDPADVALLQTIETPGFAWASAFSDNTIIVADGDAGLLIYQKESAQAVLAATPPDYPVSKTNSIEKGPGNEAPSFPENVKKIESSITCTVSSTADTGSGSLRACLEGAAAGETILFDPLVFPPGRPATISLESQLPGVSAGSITIDGSQAGVILDGRQEVPVGLEVTSSHNTIMGLQFINFSMDGITLNYPSQFNTIGGDHFIGDAPSGQGNVFYGDQNAIRVLYSNHNTILGNFVGTNADGTRAAAPNFMGIVLSNYAVNNFVGGASLGEKNIISNNGRGVDIASNTAIYNVVAGNFIGTDITGTKAIPNTDWGILIEVGGRNNIIGGTTPEARNIISGNFAGVEISDYGTSQNSIIGNYIGTDVTGTKPLPNKGGTGIFQSMYNRIGGTRPGEDNLISGNSEKGARFFGMGAVHAILLGNVFGLDAGGTKALPNLLAVTIDGGTHSMIGGLGNGSANRISDNAMGISISYAGTNNNWVAGNLITRNAQFGIVLNNYASDNYVSRNTITESNPGVLITQGVQNSLHANSISNNPFLGIELREGGNLELPAPSIENVTSESVEGTSCPYCVVELFSETLDEGMIYEGSITADKEGRFTFSEVVKGPMVAATTTDPYGNTSQLSQAVPVPD